MEYLPDKNFNPKIIAMENLEIYTQTISHSGANNLYDLSTLEEMDDTEYLLEMLTILLSENASDFKEMKQALQQGRTEILCKKAHKLKGSAGVIQAEKLAVILTDIETLGKKGIINDELISLVENAMCLYKDIEQALKKHLKELV